MSAEKIDFADSETALTTVRAMAATFDEVVASRDAAAIKVMYGIHYIHYLDSRRIKVMYGMLADATAGVVRLIRRRSVGLPHATLGSFPPERWKDLSAEEILMDLQNLVSIEELVIEIKRAKIPEARSAQSKRLSQEVVRLTRTLKGKVANAKAWIQKHWPHAWTDKEESDFRRWL